MDAHDVTAGPVYGGAEAPTDPHVRLSRPAAQPLRGGSPVIPLELGGAPADPRNLWPEPRTSPDGWGADRKDELEFALNQLVCAGRLPLREAQRAMATDWIAAYRRYVGLPR